MLQRDFSKRPISISCVSKIFEFKFHTYVLYTNPQIMDNLKSDKSYVFLLQETKIEQKKTKDSLTSPSQ